MVTQIFNQTSASQLFGHGLLIICKLYNKVGKPRQQRSQVVAPAAPIAKSDSFINGARLGKVLCKLTSHRVQFVFLFCPYSDYQNLKPHLTESLLYLVSEMLRLFCPQIMDVGTPKVNKDMFAILSTLYFRIKWKSLKKIQILVPVRFCNPYLPRIDTGLNSEIKF